MCSHHPPKEFGRRCSYQTMIRKLGSRGRCASSHTSGVATHWERTPQPAPALIEAPGISFYKKTLCCSALAEAAVIADQHRPALPSNLRASCTQLNHDTLSWFSASIRSGCLQRSSSTRVAALAAEHQACTHPQSTLHHATGEIMQDFAQRAGAEWRHQRNGTRNA